MPIDDGREPGGTPARRTPFNGQGLGDWQSFHYRRAVLTNEQRQEIREKYADALTDDPDLTKNMFARNVAASYGVSSSAIRHVLNQG